MGCEDFGEDGGGSGRADEGQRGGMEGQEQGISEDRGGGAGGIV